VGLPPAVDRPPDASAKNFGPRAASRPAEEINFGAEWRSADDSAAARPVLRRRPSPVRPSAAGSGRSGGSAIGCFPEGESREETRLPYADSGEARIWYTGQGTGFPTLTLAPGGMRSSVSLCEAAAISPLTAYAGQYTMIAMDQRNTAQSTGPLQTSDPWDACAADQLAVMDHLGIDRFPVSGCRIGGPVILKLCDLAPEQVAAAVLEQPAGIIQSNRELF
jgi:hypothetical protein